MARQFKIEVDYIDFEINAVLYWHDDDTVEFETLPQTMGTQSIGDRSNLIADMMKFMKSQKVQKVEVTKFSIGE